MNRHYLERTENGKRLHDPRSIPTSAFSNSLRINDLHQIRWLKIDASPLDDSALFLAHAGLDERRVGEWQRDYFQKNWKFEDPNRGGWNATGTIVSARQGLRSQLRLDHRREAKSDRN